MKSIRNYADKIAIQFANLKAVDTIAVMRKLKNKDNSIFFFC